MTWKNIWKRSTRSVSRGEHGCGLKQEESGAAAVVTYTFIETAGDNMSTLRCVAYLVSTA